MNCNIEFYYEIITHFLRIYFLLWYDELQMNTLSLSWMMVGVAMGDAFVVMGLYDVTGRGALGGTGGKGESAGDGTK